MSPQEIAGALCDRLGSRVTAHLVGADAQQIVAYACGADVADLHARRLRTALEIVLVIEAAYDTATAKAWLFGTNRHLGDQAPIDLLGRIASVRAARRRNQRRASVRATSAVAARGSVAAPASRASDALVARPRR